MSIKVHINNARVSFANGLFTPTALEPTQTPKYGADFIIGPDTKVFKVTADGKKVETTLKAVELEVANEAWKGKGQQMLATLEASKKAYRDGDKRVNKAGDTYDGYEGNWYVTAKNATRPTVVGANREPVSQEDGVIYSGCYVNAIVEFYANTAPTKKGVFAALKGVQFAKDGDAFGGGSPASANEFDAVAGAEAADFA